MQDSKPPSNRRTVLAGAGTAGALAAVAAVLPLAHETAPAAQPADPKATDGRGGYQLTEHVKRYYATARI
jgi:hypothetical protein